MQIQIVPINASTMEKWKSTYACSVPTAKIWNPDPRPQQQDLPLLFQHSQHGSMTQTCVLRPKAREIGLEIADKQSEV